MKTLRPRMLYIAMRLKTQKMRLVWHRYLPQNQSFLHLIALLLPRMCGLASKPSLYSSRLLDSSTTRHRRPPGNADRSVRKRTTLDAQALIYHECGSWRQKKNIKHQSSLPSSLTFQPLLDSTCDCGLIRVLLVQDPHLKHVLLILRGQHPTLHVQFTASRCSLCQTRWLAPCLATWQPMR
jgi:hypothetical protein